MMIENLNNTLVAAARDIRFKTANCIQGITNYKSNGTDIGKTVRYYLKGITYDNGETAMGLYRKNSY